ncbi:MAG: YhjD/YihY/BrkB family envelope integrity protein [Myxococcota bacterium]|nr:YhjD/YihY/BrkB family envelope integrity protein [Myxococcota bacterium]
MTAPSEIFERARRFLLRDLWHTELEGGSIATGPIRLLQFGYVVVEGFVRDELLLRASALTYMASLALIPALVVVLAVLKGLGVTEGLVAAGIDYLAIPGARETVLPYVRKVDLSGFGTVGAALLLVATVLALRHGEHAVNSIWGVVRGRSWTRRFTDYLAVLIVAPLLLAISLSLGTTLQSEPIVAWLLQFPLFDRFYSAGLRYAPFLLLVGAFSFIYWFLPNTSVRLRSAVLGGVVAAILFGLAQSTYVKLGVGAARYDALFGAAATVPLLLVWIYVSMAIFLLGAEISFAHQNLASYRREVQGSPPSAAEREILALCIALEVARAFRDREGLATAEALGEQLGIPVRIAREVLAVLEDEQIVSACSPEGREPGYQLGRPAVDIRLADVLAAVRGAPELPARKGEGPADSTRLIGDVVAELARVSQPIARDRTLASLLESLPGRTPRAAPPAKWGRGARARGTG